jgi:CBS domain-containing protein
MSVGSYCRRSPCTERPEQTLLAAAQRMEKEGVGFLVVSEGDRVAGVLTDRDVALRVAARGADAASTPVSAAMTRSPICVAAEAPLEEALGRMRAGQVRRLPVVDRELRLTGVVSADDLTRLLAREIAGLGDVLVAQLPAGADRPLGREAPQEPPRRAAEHYAREVVTSPASASIAALARVLEERAVGCAVVLDDEGAAIGLVTDRDIALRVVAAGLDPAATAASAVLSAPLVAAAPTDPLEAVVERMRTASVRRIPILRDGRPIGIVSFDDLLVAFGAELDQLGACVADELRSARIQSHTSRLRRELEGRIEEAAEQLRQLGDQARRALSGELEPVVDRLVQSVRRAGARLGERGLLRVRDRMRRDVATCTPRDALDVPARIMWERDCGCVPVVADDGSGVVVGMITDRDVCMAAHLKGARLADLRVASAMSSRVHACRPDDTVAEAEALMRSNQIRRLPVVDAEFRLCGILSLADLAEGGAAEVARTLEAICRPRRGGP